MSAVGIPIGDDLAARSYLASSEVLAGPPARKLLVTVSGSSVAPHFPTMSHEVDRRVGPVTRSRPIGEEWHTGIAQECWYLERNNGSARPTYPVVPFSELPYTNW